MVLECPKVTAILGVVFPRRLAKFCSSLSLGEPPPHLYSGLRGSAPRGGAPAPCSSSFRFSSVWAPAQVSRQEGAKEMGNEE